MNEQNPAPTLSQSTSSTEASSPSPRPVANSRKARALQNNGLGALRPSPPAAPPPVVDDSLEEGDIHVAINVSITTRNESLAKFPIRRTFYGGATSPNLFKDLDDFLQSVYEASALKVNRKLAPKSEPASEPATPPKANGQEVPIKEPVARSAKDEEFDQMFAHLDRQLRPGNGKARPGVKRSPLAGQKTPSRGEALASNHRPRSKPT